MIKVSLTSDIEKIKSIALCPEILENAAEEGLTKQDCERAITEQGWFLCERGDKSIGLIYAHSENSITARIHPYILNKFKAYSRESMKQFYIWILNNTELNKLIVSIPTHRKIVYNFAKRVGFVDEGFNRESFKKNGEFISQWMLGITRKEIELWLHS